MGGEVKMKPERIISALIKPLVISGVYKDEKGVIESAAKV